MIVDVRLARVLLLRLLVLLVLVLDGRMVVFVVVDRRQVLPLLAVPEVMRDVVMLVRVDKLVVLMFLPHVSIPTRWTRGDKRAVRASTPEWLTVTGMTFRMRHQAVRRFAAGLLLLGAAGSLGATAFAQQATVLHADIEGETITPVISNFLSEGVDRAQRDGHEAFIIALDTPGGLDTSMRQIVQSFLDARVPVVVWVPPGGRAASAGAIIGMSAHVLAMAPATAIGAATPVDLQGGDISQKIIQDATAFSVSVAEARGRNVEFAREAVTDGRSVPASEAREIGVIDLIADDLDTLMRRLDGREVAVAGGGTATLATRGAARVAHDLSFLQRVRQRLADPNLAFIFLSLGTLAIIYELANPGIGAGGVTGVILIILAMFSLSVLPVNTAGVLFLVLAMGLFVGEVFVPGIGVFAAGGAVSLVLGGLFLFRGSIGVSLALIIPTAIVVGGAVVFAGRLAWRARTAPSATGAGQVVGIRTTVRKVDDGVAQAFLEGAWWRLRSPGGALQRGQEVTIVGMEGLELIAEPAGEPDGGED